jgi:tRNA-2-methylthio-N6-dimethylallyladenosine synthase
MQSGSTRILKEMNRPYSRERFKQLVDDLRAMVPDMYFSTDIIVGFPGETEDDFELTRSLFEEIGFDMAFIFKYSTRTGTPAAILEDQIPAEVKEERNQILLDILEQSSLRRNQTLLGTVQDILVEGPARKGENMYVGRNRGYRKVIFPGNDRLIGELVPVKIEDATVTTLTGSLVIK